MTDSNNFGFSIPKGVEIKGVEVQIEKPHGMCVDIPPSLADKSDFNAWLEFLGEPDVEFHCPSSPSIEFTHLGGDTYRVTRIT